MATATKSRRTRKPAATKTAERIVAKAATVKASKKPAAKKAAPKAKPAAKVAPKPVREQSSVTATMIRGKRDWKSRTIDTAWMPAKDGGVRFEEERDNGRSPFFMDQADFADMGQPVKIRVTATVIK